MGSTTADKLNYLKGTKEEIRQAINEKGINVSTSATFRSYANSIRAIETGGVKTCRFVIGTSTTGWTEKDCDYLCDGVDDQIEINAAIQALPETGGEIKVLDGTYNITASILIDKERVTFCGCGQSTIFKRMWKDYGSAVIAFSKSYCIFKNFQIDGNKSVYGDMGSGLYLTEENMTDILVKNVFSNNNKTYGIYLDSATNSTVTGNKCNNNRLGISIESTTNSTVTGNKCNNNDHLGISIDSTTNSTVTGNTCNNNYEYGISLALTKNSTVTGNTCNNNDYGIYLALTKNSTVTGNTCLRGEGTSSDYTTSQYTIYTTSGTTNCVIVGNNCSGKAPTTSGTGNIVANNKY